MDLGAEPPHIILFWVPPRMWPICRLRYIVCVFCRTGVFSLTQEYGLQFILNCKKPGFHPHPKEPPLYQVSVVVLYTFPLYCYSYSLLSQSVFQSLTSKWSIAFLPLHRKKTNELLLTWLPLLKAGIWVLKCFRFSNCLSGKFTHFVGQSCQSWSDWSKIKNFNSCKEDDVISNILWRK